MDCQKAQEQIPAYLNDDVPEGERMALQGHFASCVVCEKELAAFEKSWEALSELEAIEPDPGYVSRFWNRVMAKTWPEKFWEHVQDALRGRAAVPVYATLALVLVAGFFAFKTSRAVLQPATQVAVLPQEEVEFMNSIDLAENLDLLESMDLLEDLDILTQMDNG